MDAITIGVGSAGTVTGVGETIKAWTNDVRIVAVEPFENQVLAGGVTGRHGIPDIGYGLVPEELQLLCGGQRFGCFQPRTPSARPAGAGHRCPSLLPSAPGLPCTPAASCSPTARVVPALAVFSGRASMCKRLLLSIGKDFASS